MSQDDPILPDDYNPYEAPTQKMARPSGDPTVLQILFVYWMAFIGFALAMGVILLAVLAYHALFGTTDTN